MYEDRSFTYVLKTQPAAELLKKAAGIEKASGEPNREKVGRITRAQLREIAETKMADLTANSVEAAMETIAELEGTGRGFFTGSLGFVDTRGHARFNILIRTLLWRAGTEGAAHNVGSFRVGGGITWGSDAAAEDAETLVKAERLIEALTESPPGSPPKSSGPELSRDPAVDTQPCED